LADGLGDGLGLGVPAAAALVATGFCSHGKGSTMSKAPGSAFDQVTHMGVTSSAVRERCDSSRRDCCCCGRC
jgi:hypothetical protein